MSLTIVHRPLPVTGNPLAFDPMVNRRFGDSKSCRPDEIRTRSSSAEDVLLLLDVHPVAALAVRVQPVSPATHRVRVRGGEGVHMSTAGRGRGLTGEIGHMPSQEREHVRLVCRGRLRNGTCAACPAKRGRPSAVRVRPVWSACNPSGEGGRTNGGSGGGGAWALSSLCASASSAAPHSTSSWACARACTEARGGRGE